MVWRTSAQEVGPTSHRSDTVTHFQPSVSMDAETAALRNRVVELEQLVRSSAEAAQRKGFAEGEQQGVTQTNAQLQPVMARLSKTLEELVNLRPRLREEAESDVVQLALAIARRVLHRELSIDPSAIQALVQVALDRLARQEVHCVRVHPAQEHAVRSALEAQGRNFEVQADRRLESGALVFETNRGKMDASVTAQFEEIERGLTDRVHQR